MTGEEGRQGFEAILPRQDSAPWCAPCGGIARQRTLHLGMWGRAMSLAAATPGGAYQAAVLRSALAWEVPTVARSAFSRGCDAPLDHVRAAVADRALTSARAQPVDGSGLPGGQGLVPGRCHHRQRPGGRARSMPRGRHVCGAHRAYRPRRRLRGAGPLPLEPRARAGPPASGDRRGRARLRSARRPGLCPCGATACREYSRGALRHPAHRPRAAQGRGYGPRPGHPSVLPRH